MSHLLIQSDARRIPRPGRAEPMPLFDRADPSVL